MHSNSEAKTRAEQTLKALDSKKISKIGNEECEQVEKTGVGQAMHACTSYSTWILVELHAG